MARRANAVLLLLALLLALLLLLLLHRPPPPPLPPSSSSSSAPPSSSAPSRPRPPPPTFTQGGVADLDPLAPRVDAVCGALYASDLFQAAAGLAAADAPPVHPLAVGGGGGAPVEPPTFVVVRGNPTSGLADHFVGATSTFVAGMVAGRRVVYSWPILDARVPVPAGSSGDGAAANGTTLPLWAPLVVTRDAALERYCDAGGPAACPVLRWLRNTQALLQPLLRPTPLSPFNDGAHGFQLVMNRGILTPLLAVDGPIRAWFAAHGGLTAATAFSCLFHSVFRLHPAVLRAYQRDTVALVADPAVRPVVGVHVRSSDSDFRYTALDQFPPATVERQRHRVRALIGCALAIFQAAAAATVNATALVVVVAGNSLAVRDAAARATELFPDVFAAAASAGVRLEVRTVLAPDAARHVARSDGSSGAGILAAVLEHWVLARARWVIKAGRSGYSTTAIVAGFHTNATAFVYDPQRTDKPCVPADLDYLGKDWSGV